MLATERTKRNIDSFALLNKESFGWSVPEAKGFPVCRQITRDAISPPSPLCFVVHSENRLVDVM